MLAGALLGAALAWHRRPTDPEPAPPAADGPTDLFGFPIVGAAGAWDNREKVDAWEQYRPMRDRIDQTARDLAAVSYRPYWHHEWGSISTGPGDTRHRVAVDEWVGGLPTGDHAGEWATLDPLERALVVEHTRRVEAEQDRDLWRNTYNSTLEALRDPARLDAAAKHADTVVGFGTFVVRRRWLEIVLAELLVVDDDRPDELPDLTPRHFPIGRAEHAPDRCPGPPDCTLGTNPPWPASPC